MWGLGGSVSRRRIFAEINLICLLTQIGQCLKFEHATSQELIFAADHHLDWYCRRGSKGMVSCISVLV